MLKLVWPVYIYEFDNAITFKHQSISLFWNLENVFEKNKTGLPLQVNISWSVFILLINWRGLYLCHIWTIQVLSLNVRVYIRFIIDFILLLLFFIDSYAG